MASPMPLFRRSIALALATGALATSSLAAQAMRDTVALKEIVVTADRFPTPAARNIASTTVITGEELRQRGVYFLDDALRTVPGAAIVPTGSYGGATSLFLRGGQSSYVKVLVDGVAQNQSGGQYNFASLTTDNVDRIEVVRGPASVLYGTDAVTGVVQIFTRKGAGPLTTEASGRAGSFGSYSGEVGIHGGTEQLSYSASLGRFATNGTYEFNSRYTNTVGSGSLTVRPDGRTDLTLSARTGDNNTHFPTGSDGVPSDSNQSAVLQGTTLSLDAGRRFTERAEVRLLAGSYAESIFDDNQPDSPGDTLGFFLSQGQSRLLRRSADVRGIFQPTERLRLTVGGVAEYQELRQLSRSEYDFGFGRTVQADPPFSPTRRNAGLYAQGLVDVTSRVLLNLGGRLDDNEEFGTHVTVRAGAVVALGAGFRTRGSVGTAFKEPSLRENFIQGAFELGNPDLKPEQSTSWELGLEQALADGEATFAVTYFDQHFRDLIQYNGGVATGVPNYQNIARATSRGLEFSANVRPVRELTFGASYTYLKTNVEDAGFASAVGGVFENGKPLIRRPEHSFRLDGRARLRERLSLGGAVTYAGKRDDVDFSSFPSSRTSLPSYTLVDADAAFDLTRPGAGRIGLTATLKVENLLDSGYQTVVGYQGRPRGVFGGARVVF